MSDPNRGPARHDPAEVYTASEVGKQAGILPAKPPGTAGYSYYLRSMGYGRYEVYVVGIDSTGKHASIHLDPTTGEVLTTNSVRPAH